MLRKTCGITIAEFVGVFAMLGVLFAAMAPHLLAVDEASRLAKLRFNLEKLRLRIDEYRQNRGSAPPRLSDALPGSPLLENPLSKAPAGCRNRVKLIAIDAPEPQHATKSGLGGWLYNPKTGGIWVDHGAFLSE